jgi:hypothetical protein
VFDCLTAGKVELGTAVPGEIQYLQFTLKDELTG